MLTLIHINTHTESLTHTHTQFCLNQQHSSVFTKTSSLYKETHSGVCSRCVFSVCVLSVCSRCVCCHYVKECVHLELRVSLQNLMLSGTSDFSSLNVYVNVLTANYSISQHEFSPVQHFLFQKLSRIFSLFCPTR